NCCFSPTRFFPTPNPPDGGSVPHLLSVTSKQPEHFRRERNMIDILGVQAVRLPIIFRVTMSLFVSCILLIGVLIIANSGYPTRTVQEPPPELLPGKQQFAVDAACHHAFDEDFDCQVNLNGSRIGLEYDNINQKIIYTSISTPDQTLGDLITAWGDPTGYTRM